MINEHDCSAYNEILEYLDPNETIEKVVLGNPDTFYGMNYHIPKDIIGVPLNWKEAMPYLFGWEISGGFGGEEVIPIYVWTDKRVLFIGCYDGSTWLTDVPRNPVNCKPYTVGGG